MKVFASLWKPGLLKLAKGRAGQNTKTAAILKSTFVFNCVMWLSLSLSVSAPRALSPSGAPAYECRARAFEIGASVEQGGGCKLPPSFRLKISAS
eukprot:6175233-Pleurochrysis_carterae.AAC.2